MDARSAHAGSPRLAPRRGSGLSRPEPGEQHSRNRARAQPERSRPADRARTFQAELAEQLKSSQSRIAKVEAADPTVSVDLFCDLLRWGRRRAMSHRPFEEGSTLAASGSNGLFTCWRGRESKFVDARRTVSLRTRSPSSGWRSGEVWPASSTRRQAVSDRHAERLESIEGVGVPPNEPEQHGGLFVRLAPPLFPPFERSGFTPILNANTWRDM